MNNTIEFLKGKKSTIASAIGLIVVFCVNRGYIQQDISELLMSLLTVTGLGINYAESKQK